MDLRKNPDGSADIYCGPKASAGFEKNWIIASANFQVPAAPFLDE
jgi:hypothetical protein